MKKVMWLVVGMMFAATPVFAAGQKPDAAKVKLMLQKTHKVIQHAVAAVKKGGQGKDDLHKAVVREHAARKALKAGKPQLAAHLTLKARGFARTAMKDNKAPVAKDEAAEAPDETAAAEGADPAQADAAVDAAAQEVPADDSAAADSDSD